MDQDDKIRDVMKSCNCGRERAMQLLTLAKNDPEKAKIHYQTYSKYSSRATPRPPKSSAATPSTKNNNIAPVSSHTSVSGDQSSTNGERIATPRPGSSPSTPVIPTSEPASTFQSADAAAGIEPPYRPHFLSSTPSSRPSSFRSFTPEANGHEKGLNGEKKDQQEPSSPPAPKVSPFVSSHNIVETSDDRADSIEESEESEDQEWDLVLPEVEAPAILTPGLGEEPDEFNTADLIGAMQHGASLETIQRYLQYFRRDLVRKEINEPVRGVPPIFFAVATNDEGILRTFVAHGAGVLSVHRASGTPLITFAMMHSEIIEKDTTHMVATLLSLGAAPEVIPAAFYRPFHRDLPPNGPDVESMTDLQDANKQWCTPAMIARLSKTINLTHRYYLERAAKAKKPSIRQRQVAMKKNAEGLLGIPYFLIGQTAAANLLSQKLLSTLLVQSDRPLVLVFAGPSGHGKTELARRLGHLLSLELEVVDCTIFSREIELFGPRAPYHGSDRGSPLNNFLARHSGERSIVFLDEFEKTSPEIHQALLLPFDKGDYQDRRHLTNVDCKRTIWILATNALDGTIKKFCEDNHCAIFNSDDEMKKTQLMKQLSKELKEGFLHRFDAPLTGRVSAYLPFLHFSPGEQAVIVHKYLLELSRKVRDPVKLSDEQDERLLGNVKLRIKRDALVSRTVAETEYHADLGARSLITAVSDMVENELVEAYLDVDAGIEESSEMTEFVVDVSGGEIVVRAVE